VDAGANTANFKVGNYNGSSWTLPSIASPNPTSIQVTGVTSFSDFAVGEIFSVLPVKLTHLRGYTKNQGIQVEWVTQSELNMDRYEIEKSANGLQFTKAGSVQAKGNSSIVVNYGWFDANPFKNINYYRIKSVEKTGEISYSQVVKVNSTGKSEIIFYPNPVIANEIKIQFNNIQKGYYTISITNKLGQQVFKKIITYNGGSAIQILDVSNLTQGTYQLNITGEGINFTKQVLKN
jgi:methionine salvage enolase-phosphatase E1